MLCRTMSITSSQFFTSPPKHDKDPFESSNCTQSETSENEYDSSISQNYPEEEPTQPEPIPVQPLYNITPRTMPESPHGVIEEQFKQNPWAMLVATIFLTKTTAKVARPSMVKFFEDFPSPQHVLDVRPEDLEAYFEPLGLRKRASMIWKMTYQFVSAKWRRASDLCGIGKYGEDAYRIFCLGHTDVEPTDRYLRLYTNWLRTQTDHLEEWGTSDCECLVVDPISDYYSISLR